MAQDGALLMGLVMERVAASVVASLLADDKRVDRPSDSRLLTLR